MTPPRGAGAATPPDIEAEHRPVPEQASPRARGPASELGAALWSLRWAFGVVGLFSLVANLLMLAPTLYMLQVYDRVLVSMSQLTLVVVSLVTLFLIACMAFAEWSRSRLLVRIGVRLDGVLSPRIFDASFEANAQQAHPQPGKAFGDLIELRQFLTGQGVFAFFDAPWTPIYIAVLFLLHPFLGWVALGFAAVQAALAWWGHRRALAPMVALQEALGQSNRLLQAQLRNAEVVESMGLLGDLRARWQLRHQAYLQRHAASHGLGHRVSAVSKWLRYSQQSLALGAGALLVIDGQLSAGGMIAANVLMTRALAPIDQMVNGWRNWLGVRAAYRRLSELLQAHPARDPALGRTPPQGRVALHAVSAFALGRAAPLLQQVSLQAEPGTVTVVLGPSGSGKSTLARVLLGIWPQPQVQGVVLLDGQPIAGWSRQALGPHIGYLPQDVELFDGSVAENIARFAQVDPAQVVAAAQAAGLHNTILRFPRGYDTPMGEAGALLSGGQRQRIGLARALCGAPALVVLDEPNAHLDDVGEQALAQAVLAMRTRGQTVFLISHRPNVVALADQVILLREGQVQWQGPRDALLRHGQPAAPAHGQAASASAQAAGSPDHPGGGVAQRAPLAPSHSDSSVSGLSAAPLPPLARPNPELPSHGL